ncbi:zinc finger protein 91 [Manduca sexta]|uniref:zinc finger protein 91 n=1 Tax=Manduca sexta TaxID=7130 RepID=UPI00188E9EE7|nr:zinc finger protein 91 [Manduca sexta]
MALEIGKCRLCLKLGDFYSIFTVDNGVQLAEMVMECSRVKIYEGDGLPDKACAECIQKLSGAYIFKQQCERADQDLRRNYVPPPGFGLSPNRQSSDSAFSTHTEYSNVNKSVSTEGKVTPASTDRKRRTGCDINDERHDYRTNNKRESVTRPNKKPKYMNNSIDSDDDDNGGSLTAESVCTEPNEITPKNEFKCTKCSKEFKTVYGLNNHMRTHRLDKEGTVTPTSTARGHSIESDNASSSSRQDYPGSTKRVNELRRLGKTAKCNTKDSSIDSDDDDNGDSSFKSETAGTDSDDSAAKKLYKCQKCPNEYTSYRALNSHMRFHKRDSVKEELAGNTAPTPNVPEVPDDDDLSCIKCGKTYKLKIMLKRHQQICKVTPQKQQPPEKQQTPLKQKTPQKQSTLQNQQPQTVTPLKLQNMQQKQSVTLESPQKQLLVCLEPVDGKHNVKVECDICSSKFKTLENLNKHLRVVHAAAPKRYSARAAGTVSVTCIYCRETFDDYYVHNAHFNTCPKKDSRETFKCPLCLVVSFKKLAYFAHIKNNHFEPETRSQANSKEEDLKCRFCNKQLATQQLLITHLAAHMSNIDDAAASDENRTVVTPNTSTPDTSKNTLNCVHCKKEFKYKRSLMNHELSCVKRDDEPDGKEEEEEENANEAESSQDEADDNTCDICEKQFSYKALLLHHKRTKHTMCAGFKRASITLKDCAVKCMICDIDMKVKDIHAHNKEHISMNMKPRNIYTCGECGEFFKNLSALSTHIKFVHRLKQESPNAKKYQGIDPSAFCEVVVAKTEPQEWPQGDYSPMPDGVVKIEGQANVEPTAFVCPTCGKNMPSATSLKCHMACHVRYDKAASGKLECFVCKETFRFQVHYKMHMRVHYNDTNLDPKVLTCSICNRKSKNLRAARAHMAFHKQTRFQNKDYQCSLCKKVFQNRRVYLYHMSIHQKRGDSAGLGPGIPKDGDKSVADGTHTCELCGKVCDSEVSLKHHIIWHKSKGSLYGARHECNICNVQFTNKRTLTIHIRTHYENDNGPYKCHLCEKGFTDEDFYRRHLKSHNFDHTSHKKRIERLRKDQVKCPICSRYYPDLVKLIRHLKRTHPESKMVKADPDAPPQRYYPCQLCAKVFMDERRLQFHKEAHLRKPILYKCKFCGKKAMSLKSHRLHIKAHLASKHIDEPLKCPHCSETFVKGYGLHHHLRDEHGINETWIADRTEEDLNGPLKDLQCSVCHKILASKGNFQRHIDYHNSLRCNYCFQYFSSLRFLEGHLSFMCEKKKLVGDTEVHPKRVKCHVCYKAFHLQVKLDCHLRTQHGIAVTKEASAGKQEIVCDYCFKVFENEYALSTHKIYHRTIGYYGCRYCPKKFNTLTLYRRHKTTHLYVLNVDNPTKCDHCDERFVAFRDMITHMKDEHGDDSEWIVMPKDSIEEKCGICNKTFFNLHKHLSYHEENKCKKCGEYFYSVVDFDNHLCAIESDDEENTNYNNGNNAKYEECNFCFKPITSTNSKLKHDKIHKGSGSISCRFCRLKFKTIDAFNIHAFTHRSSKYNKKPIKCRQCGEKFVKYGPFIKHMRNVHKSALKIHYRATVKPERCVVCGDEFPNLHNHYRAHLLNQCQQCRKYFTSYKIFTMHECDKEDSDPSKVFTCNEDLVALINSYVPKDEKDDEKLYGESGDEDDGPEENGTNEDNEVYSQDEDSDVKKFDTFKSPVISDVLSLYQKEEVASQDSESNSQAEDKDVFVISSDEESADVDHRSPIMLDD